MPFPFSSCVASIPTWCTYIFPLHSCTYTAHLSPLSLLPSFPFPSLPFVYLCPVCAGDFYSLLSKFLGESKDVVHVHKYNPSEALRAQAELVAQIDSIMQKKDLGWPSPRLGFGDREDAILVRDRVHKFHQLEATARPPGSKLGIPADNAAATEAGAQKQGGFW